MTAALLREMADAKGADAGKWRAAAEDADRRTARQEAKWPGVWTVASSGADADRWRDLAARLDADAAALRAGAEAIEVLALAEGAEPLDFTCHADRNGGYVWGTSGIPSAHGRALAVRLMATALRLAKEVDDGTR